MNHLTHVTYIVCGYLCLLAGFIGIFVPLWPTTPFVLLAAFFFSRGSERLHRWLLAHPVFGSTISAWQKHGLISLPTKFLAVLMLVGSISYALIFREMPLWAKYCAAAVGSAIVLFILTRPSGPRDF